MFVFVLSSSHNFSDFLDVFQKICESEKNYEYVSGLFKRDDLQKNEMLFMKIATNLPA